MYRDIIGTYLASFGAVGHIHASSSYTWWAAGNTRLMTEGDARVRVGTVGAGGSTPSERPNAWADAFGEQKCRR
jgi:hypothetical protein